MKIESVVNFDKKIFDDYIIHSSRPVAVVFYSTKDPKSKTLLYNMKKLAIKFMDSFKFIKVDLEDGDMPQPRYGIDVLPTMLIYCNGNLLNKITNFRSYNKLEKILIDVVRNCYPQYCFKRERFM